MKNVIDYVKEFGKYSITEEPFNDVDSLVLSQLSYLKYDGMVPGVNKNCPSVLLKDLPEHVDFLHLFDDERYEKVNKALFRAAIESRRFQNMRLNDYVNIVDAGWEIQFSAITYLFGEGLVYVAYRGTDESIVGWKEDFNMAFQTPVPAQKKAVQYLNLASDHVSGGFYVGGHSKGGNLAVYASMKCKDAVKKRILKIYSHDGPGFRQEVLDSGDFDEIKDRVHKLIPHSSLVGMLLQSQENYEVIECRSFGLLQHDPYNWIVDGTGFKKVGGLYKHVEMRDESVNQWIRGMDVEQLKEFVEQLFAVINAPGAATLIDLKTDLKKNSAAIMNAIEEMDADSKEMMKLVIKGLFKEMSEIIKLKVTKKVQPEIEKLQKGRTK
ncbi:MAG: DUF2974 domain-containing protein [Lachnospiraceae bacterium]